jgi:hypothetical protein
MFIFFVCPKKTNQKKGHPIMLFPLSNSKVTGSLKTRYAQTVQTAFSLTLKVRRPHDNGETATQKKQDNRTEASGNHKNLFFKVSQFTDQ